MVAPLRGPNPDVSLIWLHHSPSAGKCECFTGAQVKALGVKPGFPGLILPVQSGQPPGFVIEMKSDTGRVSPELPDWLDHYAAQHWATAVALSRNELRSAAA